MKRHAPGLIASALLCLLIAGCGGGSKIEQDAKELEAFETAKDAYIYAYPLMTMDMTRRVTTNVANPEGTSAPMGQFAKLREYPNASFNAVTAPNADTLYTMIWLDVSKDVGHQHSGYEGAVCAVSDAGRLDGCVSGSRKADHRDRCAEIRHHRPGLERIASGGRNGIKSPTGMVWLLGRIYCTGTPEDYKAVHALQDQMSAVPLSSYGKAYTPPPGTVDPSIDKKIAVRDQLNAMDGAAYFKHFAELLKTNPPTAEDAAMVAKLASLGSAGAGFRRLQA